MTQYHPCSLYVPYFNTFHPAHPRVANARRRISVLFVGSPLGQRYRYIKAIRAVANARIELLQTRLTASLDKTTIMDLMANSTFVACPQGALDYIITCGYDEETVYSSSPTMRARERPLQ